MIVRSPVRFALVVAGLAGCQAGPPPDLVRMELPDQLLSSDPLRPTVHVRRGGSSKLLDEPAEFAVTHLQLLGIDIRL